jgi:phosphate transport system permease protein
MSRSARRRPLTVGLLAVLALAGGLLPWLTGTASAGEGATLRVEAPASPAAAGSTFEVSIIQDAAVVTTGVQANLQFDAVLLQVVDFKLGPAYTGGILAFGSSTDGSNKSVEAAAAAANKTGVLRNVAAFLLPGSGSVPAGEAVALVVTMQALSGPGGVSNLALEALPSSPIQMLDEAGSLLPVATTGTTASIAAAPGATGPPRTPEPTAAPTAVPSPTPALGSAVITVAPASGLIAQGEQSTIVIRLLTDTPVSQITTDLLFDRTILQIIDVVPGPGWEGATLLVGQPWQTKDQVIDASNGAGTLPRVGIMLPLETAAMAPPDGILVTIRVKAVAAGTTQLTLNNAQVLDINGVDLVPQMSSASIEASAATGGIGPTQVLGIALLLIVGVVILRRRLSGEGRRRRPITAPYLLSLALALIPVAAFAAIVIVIVANSMPAFDRPGLAALLGDHFASKYSGTNTGQLGLLPAVSGTILITLVAVLIAAPVSLAMAIMVTEFPMGPVSRVLRPIVDVLAGVPPILYAVSGVVFVGLVMIPKFAGDSTFPLDPAKLGLAPGGWPPAGVPYSPGAYPWNPGGTDNSTLLGGALVALLLIPFLTPLLVDAVRNVPSAAREASFALGANRRYTLRRVLLPFAGPGIAGAIALGTLKAMGDTLIIVFAVGWEAQTMPHPIVDVLERTPSLTAEGAGLLGAFQVANGSCTPTECAVGYTSALFLLLMAGIVVVLMTLIQTQGRRRMAA